MLIETPGFFLDSIRKGTSPALDDEEVLAFLEKYYRDCLASMKSFGLSGDRERAVLFWSGALLGEKVAVAELRAHLKRTASEQNINVEKAVKDLQ